MLMIALLSQSASFGSRSVCSLSVCRGQLSWIPVDGMGVYT